jgi:hypothetical protein
MTVDRRRILQIALGVARTGLGQRRSALCAIQSRHGRTPGRHRSPGALTCAKLWCFVQGWLPFAQSGLPPTEPRTSARGFFRGDCSSALTNQLQRQTFPRAPSLRGLEDGC